jgi:hypothetical protein
MTLYRLLSLHNTIKAAAKGRLPQRLVRRAIYRRSFRAAGWLSRLLRVGR